MRPFRLHPVLLVFCAVGLLAFGLTACGGDSGDDTATDSAAEAGVAGNASGEGSTTGGDDGTTAESGEDTTAPSEDAVRAAKVEIDDFAYEPDPVTVEEGGKVIWLNRDAAPHTATAEDGSFDTGTLAEGKLKSETFKQPGTYAYICSIHPQMHGTVEVVAAG
ncbi:MAG TPA: plastocyanin/azurin family copper-binding protein [Solirubrobacterales bacterium]|jgi:plastocyanin|nr:plastocyanin/azurin family copper-binding protein [Solirubrobacterales bacterium]